MHSITIIFLDIAAIALFLVLADLSKRLGEALKTPAYYKLFWVGMVSIVLAMLINTITLSNNIDLSIKHPVSMIVSMALRFFAGCCAVFASLKYWQWLIAELLKK